MLPNNCCVIDTFSKKYVHLRIVEAYRVHSLTRFQVVVRDTKLRVYGALGASNQFLRALPLSQQCQGSSKCQFDCFLRKRTLRRCLFCLFMIDRC